MQAITTKFLRATNFHGARIKAKAQAGSITIPWDNALDVEPNHRAACEALLQRLAWQGRWVGGALPDDTGYAFVKVVESDNRPGKACGA